MDSLHMKLKSTKTTLYTVVENERESFVLSEDSDENVVDKQDNQNRSAECVAIKYLKTQAKLKQTRDEMEKYKSFRDQQMRQIISKLLLLEGHLMREKKLVVAQLAEKDMKIAKLESMLSNSNCDNASGSSLSTASEYPDSAIGSLEVLPSAISSPVSSGGSSMVNKRNNTDPDRKSIEGALFANRCRRAKTDPCKYRRYKDAEVETEKRSMQSIAVQTEPSVPEPSERRISSQPLTKERSYSDPADVDALYDKTRCDSETDDPPPLPPRLSRIRKKSLSSPDIRQSYYTSKNQPPIPHRRRKSSAYINRPMETSCDTHDFILERDEPLQVVVRPPRPESLIGSLNSSKSASEASSSNPSTPKLIKRKKVILRSYSNPVAEFNSRDTNETRDACNNQIEGSKLRAGEEHLKQAAWLCSKSEPESGDTLINGAAQHFISEKAIYF